MNDKKTMTNQYSITSNVVFFMKGKSSFTTWNDKGKIDVSSEGPSSGVSSGGRGKPRVFLYELVQKHHVTI